MLTRRMTAPMAAIAIVALMFALAGCGKPASGPAQPATEAPSQSKDITYPNGVIKIGIPTMLTGSLAADGKENVDGANMALKEINAAGGVCGYKVEPVVVDIGEREQGVITNALDKLILSEKVDAILTTTGSTTMFELDLIKKHNMVYINAGESMRTVEKVSPAPDQWPTVFNIQPYFTCYRNDPPRLMNEWAEKGLISLPNRKVAIISSDNAYSKWISDGLVETFPSAGWEVTMYEVNAFGNISEWGPILSKIRANPPALIINCDYLVTNEATFLEQFLQNPTQSHIFMQYGPSTAEFLDVLGAKGNGILYNLPTLGPYVDKYELAINMKKKMTKEFGYEPAVQAYNIYDIVYIWADACRRAGDPKDHLAVGKMLLDRTAHWGSTGLIAFDRQTHTADTRYMPSTFYQIWDGKRYCIYPDDYQDAPIKNPPWWK